jgi:hypothetical protein
MADLTGLINQDEDRVMIIDLGPNDGKMVERIEFMGVHKSHVERKIISFPNPSFEHLSGFLIPEQKVEMPHGNFRLLGKGGHISLDLQVDPFRWRTWNLFYHA